MKARLLVAVGIVGVVALSVLGAACASTPSGGAALELAPANSIGYVSFSIQEGSDQEQALEDLLAKFEPAPTLEEAKQRIGDSIFDAAGLDISYDNDVQEWLGDEAAFFVQSFDQDDVTAAALIETTDQGATQDMMDEIDGDLYQENPEAKSYEGVDYDYYSDGKVASGFVEDFWVIGSEAGFKSVVDTSEGGRSLTDSDNFDRALEELPAERLGLFYIDSERLSAAMEGIGGASSLGLFSGFGLEDAGATAGVLYAQPNAAVFEFAAQIPEETSDAVRNNVGKSGLLPEMPEEAWAALGAEELGTSLGTTFDTFAGMPGSQNLGLLEQQLRTETGLEFRDLLSWMGDGGAFVRGQNLFELQAGFVIESRDRSKSADAIDKLGIYLRSQGVPVRPAQVEGLQGFAIQEEGMPQPVNFLAGEEKVVIAYGDDATSQAIRAREPLGDSDEFQAAADLLGDDFGPAFYLNLKTVVAFAEAMGASGSPEYEEDVKPWLDPLTHVIFGSKIEGDTVIQKFVIGVE